MKTNWQIKKLSEICEIVGGGTPKTGISKYWGGDLCWVTPKDLGRLDSFQISETERKISESGLKNSSAQKLPIGSVILSSRAPIGYVVINTVPMATNQGCRSFICGSEIFNKYLYYFLFSNTELLNSLGSGSTFLEVSGSRLKEIEIPLPPLEIQKKIVEILDEKFAKIREVKSLREQSIAETEKILSQTLREIFEEGKEKGWEEVFLKDIAKYSIGLTYSPSDVGSKGTIVLRSSNVQKDLIDLSSLVRVEKKIKEELFVKDGDILMCSRNGSKRLIGKTAMIKNLTEKMTFGTFMTIIRSENNAYLYYFFKSKLFFDQFSAGGGPMINQITKYMLDDIKLIIPPFSEQKKIVERLDTLSEKIRQMVELQKSQLEDFKKLEKSYLREAFNGELV
ncbi:restriction endonuclease subunit S [Candidatus Nomurabacteria bacterium]|nr:restriction endonuclease subunit S [Candidatus Nomurabacteria bacterium]